MRIVILVVLAGLFGSIPFPASAHPDDRYFDSRAAAPVKPKVHKAVRRIAKTPKQHMRYRRAIWRAHLAGEVSRATPRITTPEHKKLSLASGWGRTTIAATRETANYTLDTSSTATVLYSHNAVIGGRPAGCPSRFCGCGASLEVFGRIIPALNLAANWLRFPRTSPAPGMVAARRGHVFVLRQALGNGVWMVHDSNSGGRMTRIHPRSLAGYAIVNPRGVGLFLR